MRSVFSKVLTGSMLAGAARQVAADAPQSPANASPRHETLVQHAHSTVEAEGRDEWPEGLVEHLAKEMFHAAIIRRYEAPFVLPAWPPLKEIAWEWRHHATAALSAIRAWEGRE